MMPGAQGGMMPGCNPMMLLDLILVAAFLCVSLWREWQRKDDDDGKHDADGGWLGYKVTM